jgi:predicted alpha/beta-fold hydrolase
LCGPSFIAHAVTHSLFFRGLDFAPIDSSDLKDDTPIVVVQHGLSGGTRNNLVLTRLTLRVVLGSYEPYVKEILSRACAPVEAGGLGYRAVVVNFRGCLSFLFQSCAQPNNRRQAQEFQSLHHNSIQLAIQMIYGLP